MKAPIVSIIIPVLNCDRYISCAINSALNQSFQDFEIIVVDGNSEDQTSLIVKQFIEKDERINFIKQSKPGLAYARNCGVEIAKGDYIAFLEPDDLWHQDKLLFQMKSLRKNPEAGLASCYSLVIDENGLLLGWRLGVNVNGMVYEKVIEKNPISNCSVPLIRRKCLQTIGLFNEKVKYGDDAEMWIRFTKKFPMTTVPKGLVGYRRWSGNRSKDYAEVVEDGESTLRKTFFKDNPALSKELYNFCISRNSSTIAGLCIIDRRYREARKHLIQSLKKNKIALLRDSHMFGIAILVISVLILRPFIFEKVLLNLLLPIVFRTIPGKKFIDDQTLYSDRKDKHLPQVL